MKIQNTLLRWPLPLLLCCTLLQHDCSADTACVNPMTINYAIEVAITPPPPQQCSDDDLYWIARLIQHWINRMFIKVGQDYGVIQSENFICKNDPDESTRQLTFLNGNNNSNSTMLRYKRQYPPSSLSEDLRRLVYGENRFIFYGGGWCTFCRLVSGPPLMILIIFCSCMIRSSTMPLRTTRIIGSQDDCQNRL